ncbi:HAD-IB family phosphatase [Desulfomonile tiedjei]|uniref:phosphoglycolate phosphatase n=1 Tax=Desulfomonile tiedjei (strain ATCC 49306 / DSM 6799 / DCB-1) TaxID=706587 RepID=I4C2X0_DESTA|nr:HAD-IB family phosphatase [Desulfomonile tiedjei]AFM23911.1 haloacid dehalogenase superfamily protein, subfamily IB, phosphoserine phosphatase-like,haloacid dehalogenase superfamily enzyme, subfamily IA [Desulfomonile tiedjei DSM 6799]
MPHSSYHETLPQKILILCDFDGTVSVKDTVNRLVRSHCISPEWRFHVKRYLRGDIGSREAYLGVAPLMRMCRQQLEEFVLEHAELDPHFPDFLRWARSRGIDVKIVSDGFEATIRTLFRNHGIEGLEIFANRLIIGEDSKVKIEHPYANPDCGICGTCKLKILESFRSDYDKIILIGDGESDRHAAQNADVVIALKDLWHYCAIKGIPAIRAESFAEVPLLLTRRIEAVTFDMDGTLVDSIDSITDAFNYMFAQLGYPRMTRDQIIRVTSISLMDFVRSFLKPEESEIGIKIFREYYGTIFLQRTTVIPGVREMLDVLNGTATIGIITNKKGRYARILAEHLGLATRMKRIIGAEDGFKAKPSPEMFVEFMDSVSGERETTIYVGDAPIDIESARNAGIDAFAIAGDFFSPEELAVLKPRRILNNISELPKYLSPVV